MTTPVIATEKGAVPLGEGPFLGPNRVAVSSQQRQAPARDPEYIGPGETCLPFVV
jgi:hypothetical protein